jgi:two-component system phosphate regulon sensor histidine kinase PhoR
MKRLHWLAILMTTTILGIAGFQAFWLKQTYDREKKNLNFKTEVAFVTTVHNLQASKLKLGKILSDSTLPLKRVFIDNKTPERFDFRVDPRGNMVTTIKVLQDKIKDSLLKKQKKKPGVVISMNNTIYYKRDSVSPPGEVPVMGEERKTGEIMLRILSDVDSLQDTIKVKEITGAYSDALKKQKIQVPFNVLRLDSADKHSNEPGSNEVTVGFVHPITYKMELGNSFPYLLKQITSPVIFSIFLVGVTILSFLLLYRSLLRQHKLAQLKNEFISNITHELKTPIATVGVAIEALKNFNAMQDPQRTREYLDISSNELQRLGLLVDKVLKLSMFEKKEIELKYEMLNLKDVVEEVVSSMRLQLEKYHARVSVNTDGDLNMQGDRLHLLSVVFNLLDNALKYSKGDPSIQVDMKGDENNVIISVTDNGIGIFPEYKDKLFEKFFRVPTGDTHNAKGYGLGLSYAAHVVHQHKGTIAVESQPGIGSKFIITLPRQQS